MTMPADIAAAASRAGVTLDPDRLADATPLVLAMLAAARALEALHLDEPPWTDGP